MNPEVSTRAWRGDDRVVLVAAPAKSAHRDGASVDSPPNGHRRRGHRGRHHTGESVRGRLGVSEGLAAGMPIELVTFITIADLSAMVVFAVLTGLALSWRRHPEAHSRLLLLASIAMSSPAFGRLSINTTGTPLVGISIQAVLPLLVVLHDRIVTKRVHPATTWGSIAVIGSLVSSTAVVIHPDGPVHGSIVGALAPVRFFGSAGSSPTLTFSAK